MKPSPDASPNKFSSRELARRAERLALQRAESARLPRSLQALDPMRMLTPLEPPPGTSLAPSPAGAIPVLGHLRAFGGGGQERMYAFLSLRDELGDVIRFQLGGLTAHLVSDPDLIRIMLHEKHRIYTKNTRGMYKLRLVLGDGLLTSQGSSWLRNRRIAQPAFHRKRIAGFATSMTEAAEEMSARWKAGQTLDVHHEMMRVTLRIIASTMLSADVTDVTDKVGEAVSYVIEDVNRRLNSAIDLPPPLPTQRNRAFKRAMETLDQVVLDTIEARRRSGEEKGDLLDMFMNATDADTGEQMDDAQLRDEVMTIFLAGHETTANALSWTFYLLSKNPEWARRVRAEVLEVLGDRSPTAEDVKGLELCKRVLQESMRLYPPAWMTARSPNEDTTLGGYHIPKESLVLASPWVVGRHPAHWTNPEGFDPDRFLPERSEGRHRFAYFPFGGGPRICIGNNFAMMEAQLILATVLRDWNLDLVSGHPIELDPVVTLRPKHGLRMRLRAAE